ncbi:MAG: orotate phosphoribosyltransferase [Nitrospirae bacterium GWC2_46_6]|nr:MAG: orotate phosphoribosyltransferase [Nitrospirae bacterium GWA2_46_11]OGW20269.1 MAG: orotate phosphoribosyltransferase [Nitrospirae bacterium GWC2_46_6]OGW22872.1 MAG: orotate phosphoribosyltransferase [Nitrospirae bacterium GWB2_47_37]HAK89725.1 orotate phosphoribosyltransferase [Nitrospiraceae bacterium]HCL82275.1 orotate phosphoribosyltransferase [Nitrospiraceae bacterium]
MKDRLIRLIYDRAFKYSAEPVFKLVSGRMSNYYFNCKMVTLNPEGMYLISNIIFDMIKDLNVKGIGGLTLGADPIADAVAYTSYLKENPIEAFVVRKSAKSHGTMQWIEGDVKAGDRVVIVDDVITTGKSTIEAITRAREAGLNIVKVIALVDRQEGGYENIAEALKDIKADYKLIESVITRDDVMRLYESK